jgi:transcriptional regulator with XRE-family HTH domain
LLQSFTEGIELRTIGEKLKEIREYLRFSQQELGIKIGLSKQGISKIENNQSFMSKEVLNKLIIDLNINVNWLIADVGEMFITKETPVLDKLKDEGVEADAKGYLKLK